MCSSTRITKITLKILKQCHEYNILQITLKRTQVEQYNYIYNILKN